MEVVKELAEFFNKNLIFCSYFFDIITAVSINDFLFYFLSHNTMYIDSITKYYNMVTITFKAQEELKELLEHVAKQKGVNISAYIKLVLNKALKKDMQEVTENGLTVAEEIEVLRSEKEDKIFGPFDDVDDLMKSLKENK